MAIRTTMSSSTPRKRASPMDKRKASRHRKTFATMAFPVSSSESFKLQDASRVM